MGLTAAEKILSRAAGLPVRAGDSIQAKPDFVLAYLWPGFISDMILRRAKEEFCVEQVREPERFALFIDHNTPSTNAKSEQLHELTRAWCAETGVALYDRKGIGHLVAAEQGYAVPGSFVVHFDGHVNQLGALGALAMGLQVGVVEAFVRDHVSIRVPSTVRIEFIGKMPHGVMARDVFHHVVGKLGSSSCRNSVMELAGPSLEAFTVGDLQGFTGLAMFTGAVAAMAEPTDATMAYALPRARLQLEPVISDPDADYAAVHMIDLDQVEPCIVVPPSPANTRRLVDYLGLPMNVGYIGSCASGRIEDLRAAAEVLRGRKVRQGFQLNVVPSSNEIMAQASREGLLSTLIEAGAFISPPTCSFCYGGMGVLLPGQRAMSTGTLNVRGRMGSDDAEIYLCSAASVAASAIAGQVADPRDFLVAAA